MGIFGAIAAGVVAIKYTANVDEAVAAVKGLSGEQKKAAKQAVEAHKQEREEFKKKVEEFGKGAAIIGGALLVARNGLQAYREESRLMAGAAGVDIGELSDAYDGLRTRTELLTLAQAGHQGAWKLTTAQIENVIGGMRALEKKGFDSQQVFERFTDVIKKGKLEGLDDFGLSLKATGNQTDDLKVLMSALGREVLDVGANFEMAGDATTRATTRMVDGVTRVRVIVGEATNALIDMAASFGEGWGQAIFGNLPQDVGTGGRADVYEQRFSGLRGATVNDPNKIRIGNQKGADFLFAQPKDADIAAARTLANFKTALNKGMQGWGPLATASPEDFARVINGLPKDWRLVDEGLAKNVDAMQARLTDRFNKVGVDAAQGILTGFKNALSKNRADVARSRGGGRGRAANDNLGPGLFFGAVGTVAGAVERLASETGAGHAESAGPAGGQLARAQRVAVHRRVVAGRHVDRRHDVARQHAAQRVADRGPAGAADVDGPGGVGRHELDQHALAVVGLEAELFFGSQHLAHDLLFGRRLQTDVDEAGACNLDVLHPLLVHGCSQQRVAQLLTELTGVEFEGFGQLHGSRDGEVAMRGDLGRFKSGLVARAGQQTVEGLAQGGQQFLFNLEHG